jgi:histone-lysine N-methyltransferase SETD3
MLPLIDICNHSFEPNVEVRPGAAGAMELRALAPLPPGEPLLLSYGPLSNDFLLMDYGFIVPGNPHDRAALRFSAGLLDFAREVAGLGALPFGAPPSKTGAGGRGASDADELSAAPWQRAVLSELKLIGTGANLELNVGGPSHVDPRLLAALRLLYCTDAGALRGMPRDGQGAETPCIVCAHQCCALALNTLFSLSLFLCAAAYLQAKEGTLSPSNERAALATAAAVCAVALSQWPGTLADDEALLSSASSSDTPMSDDTRLAVAFRAGKKRVLADAVAGLKVRMAETMTAAPAPAGGAAAPPTPGGGAGKPRGFGGKARG